MKYVLIACFLLFIKTSYSQNIKQNILDFNYNYQIPIGELSKKFGHNSSISMSYTLENKNNILFGIDIQYIYGNNVNDSNILNNISTNNGEIIGSDGYLVNINLMERGTAYYIFGGYALHTRKNSLSGFYISTGIGYLQHKIFIDTKNQNIPQLEEIYKKGYDQLTGGISSKLTLDYKYYSRKNNIQFTVGVNYILGVTMKLRPYTLNTMSYTSNKKNLDQLIGCKAGIIIPIKKRNEEKFHYY